MEPQSIEQLGDTEARYLQPTQEAGKELVMRQIQGPVVMLNLMRFRKVADYSASPGLAPAAPISGEAAYQLYMDLALPYLKKSGGEIIFLGEGGRFMIGPPGEHWDLVMLVRQKTVADFIAFATNPEYLAILAHRTAALEDSRLLPIVEDSSPQKRTDQIK